jgi:hypothetical protein
LSKAARDFRRLHAERQELLQQWEGVLEAIRKRDAAILEAGKWLGPATAVCRCCRLELGDSGQPSWQSCNSAQLLSLLLLAALQRNH